MITYGEYVIHELAVKSNGTITAYRIVLGRCLLAIDRAKLYANFGCSSSIHYAINVLGLGQRHAQTLRRVANQLESLPKLTRVAEFGGIEWSKLRAIVSKATPETESAWIQLAEEKDSDEIARLAACTDKGALPWNQARPPEPNLNHFRLQLQPETHLLFQRAARALSRQMGRSVSVTQTLEHLVEQHLAAKRKQPEQADASNDSSQEPVRSEDIEEARSESVEDDDVRSEPPGSSSEPMVNPMALRKARHADFISKARDLAEELKARETSNLEDEAKFEGLGEALKQALGTSQVYLPDSEFDGEGSEESSSAPAGTRLEEWERLVAASAEPCPGNARALLVDPDHWKARRTRFNPSKRHLTPAQRQQILMRDGHRCRTPGCPHHVWLDIHHYVPFSQMGPTLPRNLITLCTRCHRNVHLGLLLIVGDEESGFRFLDRCLLPIDKPVPLQVAEWLDYWVGWRGTPYDCHKGRAWAQPPDVPPDPAQVAC